VNLHDVLEQCLERLAGVLEDARYEQRDGYTFLAFPTFPVRDLNGMWVDSDAAVAHIEAARAEAQELGTPFSIMVREGRTPGVERAAVELGFEPTVRIPGMAVTPSELREPEISDCEVIRVETADGLAEAMAVGAAGFGISADLVASIYSLEVAELDGLEYYLARADSKDVATAAGFTIGEGVGIFSVATPAEHRGRGYGTAVTAQAVRDGFAAGAKLAALQSSSLGESVYTRLGFRELERYVLYALSPKS
jgi:ribosomal protein S18 acetylase RimI-like enzyme